MSESVYVVTMPELGWDCVIGVFDSNLVTQEELEQQYTDDQYVIHQQYLQTSIEE